MTHLTEGSDLKIGWVRRKVRIRIDDSGNGRQYRSDMKVVRYLLISGIDLSV
jgi:hypothetical protein